MSDIAELRASIKRNEAWRAYYMQILDLWAHAAEAGYTADQIKAFSFRDKFIDPKHRRRYTILREDGKQWHNCVRLNTGELRPIPEIARPQRPEGDEPT
jgi:hypothetical protein